MCYCVFQSSGLLFRQLCGQPSRINGRQSGLAESPRACASKEQPLRSRQDAGCYPTLPPSSGSCQPQGNGELGIFTKRGDSRIFPDRDGLAGDTLKSPAPGAGPGRAGERIFPRPSPPTHTARAATTSWAEISQALPPPPGPPPSKLEAGATQRPGCARPLRASQTAQPRWPPASGVASMAS